MPFYPQSATNHGACPTLSHSIVFTFGLVVESIKELGGVSGMVVRRYFYVDIDPITREVAALKMMELITRFPQ
jgi:hypothetical protein